MDRVHIAVSVNVCYPVFKTHVHFGAKLQCELMRGEIYFLISDNLINYAV